MNNPSLNIFFNTVGLIGAVLFLVAYFLLQRGAVTDNDPRYLLMNLVGSFTLIISLLWAWNLASFVMEVAWGSVSIYGLVKVRNKTV